MHCRFGILLLGLLLLARPASAVRVTADVFLGDLNDYFFGVGETIVFAIDPATNRMRIDADATDLTLLGQPLGLELNAILDPSTGLFGGTGFLDVPQIGLVGPIEHADGGIQGAGTSVDVAGGLGTGATISLVMNSGCVTTPVATAERRLRPRHFAECAVTLFLTAIVRCEEFGDVDCATAPQNARCEDGNACTSGDVCERGTCVSGATVDCDDGDPCTTDTCAAGIGCVHADGDPDRDGVCSAADNCPTIANPDQADVNPADGIGDACECREAAPGSCVADGRGARAAECLAEWLFLPAPTPAGGATLPPRKIECQDGTDCDRDGLANGSCRFRLSVCLNNRDPRTTCTPGGLTTFELKLPKRSSRRGFEADAARGISAAVAALGPSALGGKRLDQLVFSPPLAEPDLCSAPVDLEVPLAGSRGQMKIVAFTAGEAPGSIKTERDKDALKLLCLP